MGSENVAVCSTLDGLSEGHRRRVLERYEKLRPHLEHDVPLKRVAAEAGLPLRTAQRWVGRYRRFGLAGLSRAARADRGKRRRLSEELHRLADGLALQNPLLRPAAIYREVCRVAKASGQIPPGYHTLYNLIRTRRAAPPAPFAGDERREEFGVEQKSPEARSGEVSAADPVSAGGSRTR